MTSPRVVSLVPSATETLVDMGVAPIGVTKFCERPDLVAMGGTKDPHIEQIIRAKPDLVVMCDQENRREDYEALTSAGLSVFAFSLTDVAQVEAQVAALRARLGLSESVPAYDVTKLSSVHTIEVLEVWVPIWKRPWMTIGGDTYASTLLAAAGFRNVYGDDQVRYPETPLNEVIERRAHFVLAPDEPFPFTERHRQQLETVAPVRFVSGKDLFWWGARTPTALERLRELNTQLVRR